MNNLCLGLCDLLISFLSKRAIYSYSVSPFQKLIVFPVNKSETFLLSVLCLFWTAFSEFKVLRI